MGLTIALEDLGDAAPDEESPPPAATAGAASWRYTAYRSWSVMSMSTMTYAFGMWASSARCSPASRRTGILVEVRERPAIPNAGGRGIRTRCSVACRRPLLDAWGESRA